MTVVLSAEASDPVTLARTVHGFHHRPNCRCEHVRALTAATDAKPRYSFGSTPHFTHSLSFISLELRLCRYMFWKNATGCICAHLMRVGSGPHGRLEDGGRGVCGTACTTRYGHLTSRLTTRCTPAWHTSISAHALHPAQPEY